MNAELDGFSRVVVSGSLAYDHIMSMPGRFADQIMPDKIHMINVSFLMETFRRRFGGTGGNIVYSLALLEVPSLLVAAVGHDFGFYREHLSRLNKLKPVSGNPGVVGSGGFLDTSTVKVFEDLATAQGFVMTDRSDNQIWGFYSGAMREGRKIGLGDKLRKNDLVMLAPNDVAATVRHADEAIGRGVSYMFDPAFGVALFKVSDLRRLVKNCAVLIGNDYEVELIRRRLGIKDSRSWLKKFGVEVVVTTMGARGSVIWQRGKVYKIPAAKVTGTNDPTGAGDAYRAGFLAGYVQGLSLDVCGRMGSVAAAYTVEKYGTQTHKFKLSEFKNRYKNNFGDGVGF